jgi:glycosyl hydrolase family 123
MLPRSALVKATAPTVLLIVMALSGSTGASAEEMRLPAVADVWVSSYRGETDWNVGAGNRLKLKGWQEMFLVRFDVSKLKGRHVTGGRLYVKEVGKKNALRKIGLSTVPTRWVEGSCTTYGSDDKGHGATFNAASYKRRAWGHQGSDLSDVTMGNGNSLQHHTELVRLKEGWIKVDVPAYLIQAMAAGASDGLLVMDESNQSMANSYVASRESGKDGPYLVVDVRGTERYRPRAPRVMLRAEPARARLGRGAAALLIDARGAFAYDITLNGKPLDRWRVPFPKGVGEPVTIGLWTVPSLAVMDRGRQKVVIDDLAPGADVEVRVRVLNTAGLASDWTAVKGRSSAALAKPGRLQPRPIRNRAAEPPVHSRVLRAWAFPEVVKVDPLGGRDAKALRRANAVWSGGDNAITLSAARGEIVAYQLCVEAVKGELKNVRIVPDSLLLAAKTGRPRRALDRSRIELYTVWYVKTDAGWQGEYAIPMRQGAGFDVPSKKNGVKGQANQAVYVDIFVPKDTTPGDYAGSVSVSARGVRPVKLPVKLTVHEFTLPDTMNFYGDLNCYRGPGDAGSAKFRASHRLAHAHRCAINRVPYNQRGGVDTDMAPPLTGRGAEQRVSDWRAYDRDVGPLLDGSMFKGCPRDGVPIHAMQMPFHENWPNTMAKHFDYRGPQRGKGIMKPFAMNAKPPQRAFSKEFQAGFSAVARDFAEHAKKRGWTRTEFQCLLNNKWYFRAGRDGRGTRGSSWWCLDEPTQRDDFEAIAFFGTLFQRGVRPVKGVNFGLRVDLSLPRRQRNWMNGLLNTMCVGGELYPRARRCEIVRREVPCTQVRYGSCNAVEKPNVITLRWCYEAYMLGARGVLPWQSLAGDKAFVEPDRNGLIVDGARRFGEPAIASLRVKTIRRGVQDIEYLIALAAKRGWNREQVRHLLTGTGEYRASVDRMRAWDVDEFTALRNAIAREIDGR